METMMLDEKKLKSDRISSLDITRTLAILLVVLCHSIENVYDMKAGSAGLSDFDYIFSLVAFTLSRCGVPFFLFISGSLLLSKKLDTHEDCIRFYKHNFLRLLLTVEIWNVLYGMILMLSGDSLNYTGGYTNKETYLLTCSF